MNELQAALLASMGENEELKYEEENVPGNNNQGGVMGFLNNMWGNWGGQNRNNEEQDNEERKRE